MTDKISLNNVDLYQFVGESELARVDMNYPGYDPGDQPDRVRELEIDICAVRATDGIRVSFDFTRNGWSIKQASTFCWTDKTFKAGIEDGDMDWQEVAFIPAWKRKDERIRAALKTLQGEHKCSTEDEENSAGELCSCCHVSRYALNEDFAEDIYMHEYSRNLRFCDICLEARA